MSNSIKDYKNNVKNKRFGLEVFLLHRTDTYHYPTKIPGTETEARRTNLMDHLLPMLPFRGMISALTWRCRWFYQPLATHHSASSSQRLSYSSFIIR